MSQQSQYVLIYLNHSLYLQRLTHSITFAPKIASSENTAVLGEARPMPVGPVQTHSPIINQLWLTS